MVKKYEIGNVILGKVTGIKDYGIFVKLDSWHSGLIHISEIDNCYVDNLNTYVEIGELIRVVIVGRNNDNMLNLSIKNIDYRITKQKGSKIVETAKGFTNLALHLDYWIEKELKK